MPKAQRHGSCQCENSNTCPIPGWQPSQAHSSLTPAAGPVCLTRRMLGAASIPTYQALGMRARRRATRPKERAPRRVRRHLAEPCASAGCGKGSPATNRKKKRGCDRGVDRAEEGRSSKLQHAPRRLRHVQRARRQSLHCGWCARYPMGP